MLDWTIPRQLEHLKHSLEEDIDDGVISCISTVEQNIENLEFDLNYLYIELECLYDGHIDNVGDIVFNFTHEQTILKELLSGEGKRFFSCHERILYFIEQVYIKAGF